MLTTGLVISAPAAVLLASAALALLAGKLRHRWQQAVNPRLRGPDVTRAETSRPPEHPADLGGRVPAPFAQARLRRQRDDLLCSR